MLNNKNQLIKWALLFILVAGSAYLGYLYRGEKEEKKIEINTPFTIDENGERKQLDFEIELN